MRHEQDSRLSLKGRSPKTNLSLAIKRNHSGRIWRNSKKGLHVHRSREHRSRSPIKRTRDNSSNSYIRTPTDHSLRSFAQRPNDYYVRSSGQISKDNPKRLASQRSRDNPPRSPASRIRVNLSRSPIRRPLTFSSSQTLSRKSKQSPSRSKEVFCKKVDASPKKIQNEAQNNPNFEFKVAQQHSKKSVLHKVDDLNESVSNFRKKQSFDRRPSTKDSSCLNKSKKFLSFGLKLLADDGEAQIEESSKNSLKTKYNQSHEETFASLKNVSNKQSFISQFTDENVQTTSASFHEKKYPSPLCSLDVMHQKEIKGNISGRRNLFSKKGESCIVSNLACITKHSINDKSSETPSLHQTSVSGESGYSNNTSDVTLGLNKWIEIDLPSNEFHSPILDDGGDNNAATFQNEQDVSYSWVGEYLDDVSDDNINQSVEKMSDFDHLCPENEIVKESSNDMGIQSTIAKNNDNWIKLKVKGKSGNEEKCFPSKILTPAKENDVNQQRLQKVFKYSHFEKEESNNMQVESIDSSLASLQKSSTSSSRWDSLYSSFNALKADDGAAKWRKIDESDGYTEFQSNPLTSINKHQNFKSLESHGLFFAPETIVKEHSEILEHDNNDETSMSLKVKNALSVVSSNICDQSFKGFSFKRNKQLFMQSNNKSETKMLNDQGHLSGHDPRKQSPVSQSNSFHSSRIFVEKKHHQFEKVETRDELINDGMDIDSDSCQEEVSEELNVHKKIQSFQAISNFQGAWKAATNTSIQVPSPDHHHLIVNQLSSHELLQQPAGSGDKRISVMRNTFGNNSKPLVDQRQVEYCDSTARRYSNVKQKRIESPNEHVVLLQTSHKNEDISHSRHENKWNPIATKQTRVVNAGPALDKTSARTVRSISDQDCELEEKEFVDWFSKHILPTQAFKIYMEKKCSKLTSNDLAVLPFDFLEYFQNGDQHALNCLPKNHIDAQTLYSYLSMYRRNENKTESHSCESENVIEDGGEPSYSELVSQKKVIEVEQSNSKQDVTIPVLISGTCAAKDEKQSSIFVPKNLDRSADNVAFGLNTLRPLDTIDMHAALISTQSQNQYFSQSSGSVHSVYANKSSNVTGDGHDCVNPRWNAEVQQFIGRTQSAHRKPIYIEYLEKTAPHAIVSGKRPLANANKKIQYDKRSSPPIPRRKSLFDEKRFKSHVNDRKPSSSSDSRVLKNISKADEESCQSKNMSLSELEGTRKVTQCKAVSAKTPVLEVKRKKQSMKKKEAATLAHHNRPKLVVKLTSASSREVSSGDIQDKLEDAKPFKDGFTGSLNNKNYQSLYATGKVETMLLDNMMFSEADMELFKSNKGIHFKNILKNATVQSLNFLYSFEKYNKKKIKEVVSKVGQYNKDSWSVNQILHFLKELFEESSIESFQPELKKKVEDRGESWARIKWKFFKRFHDKLVTACESKLNKTLKFQQQNKHAISEMIKEYELLYPQYCGDVLIIIKMWLWKNQANQYQLLSEEMVSSEILKTWKSTIPTTETKKFLEKAFRYPPFNSTNHRCVDVISVLNSKKNLSKEAAINLLSTWWLESYYKWKYSEVEDDDFVTLSPKELIVIDEENSGKHDSDGEENIFEHGSSHEMQESAMKEYTEDDSGAPTILLY